MMRIPAAVPLILILPLSAQAGEDITRCTVSLTISPLHLLNPELCVSGELRLARKAGVAATLAAGWVTDEGYTYSIREAGAQLRYYALGSFSRGMMLGVDVGYVDVNGLMENPMAYLVGARAGAFLGYKTVFGPGFTVETQLGPVVVRDGTGSSELQTLLNLKAGWSF